MKKITLCLMLIFTMLIVPVAIFAAEGDVAKIGDVGYATLADAVKAVSTDKTETTIELLKNVENGPGIVIENGQNVIIDFNGYSYDASEPTVGSDGTKTLGAQLKKGSTVVFKNGTFTTTKGKRVIQNYANLTLEDMVIDGTKSSNKIGYVASFNNGEVNIIGNTSIIATEGNMAFDNYFWPDFGYTEGAQITINTTGTIKGNIEFASSTKGLETALPSTLTIKNVKHDGIFNYVDERFKNAFTVEGGTYTDLGGAVVGVNKDNKEVTIKLLKSIEDGSGIVTVNGQNVVIDFNGFSYDASNPTVGSDGTKTNSCQLNKGSTVTFKNGTFTTFKAKRLVQNYANLTLENMVIDGTKGPIVGYVASFNNGKVEIKGETSILAKEGDCAFDVCWWPKGYPNGTQVVVNTTGKIDGNIEIGDCYEVTDAQKANVKSTLEIKDAYLEGEIKIAKDYFNDHLKDGFKIIGGSYTTDVTEVVAEGLVCKKISDVYKVGVEHTITVKQAEGGKVTASATKAIFGETVILKIEVNDGYVLKSLEYSWDEGNSGEDLLGRTEFVMVNADAVITPVFEKLTTEAEVPSEVANEKEVEEMLIETLEELAKDPKVAAKLEGKNIEVEVKVNSADKTITDSEKADIEKEAAKKVEDLKVASYLDITIVIKDAKTDAELTTISEVKEAITFTVAVPEGLPKVAEGYTRIFYIIRNHDGAIDVWETKEVEGKLSFESDKFSTYAIAYKDVENSGEGEVEVEPEVKPEVKPATPDVPKTGDNIVIYAIVAVVAIAGIVVAIKMRKK